MNITATLIGQMLVFTVLIWFIKAVLWEPMINMLEDRKNRIADGLAAAERGAHEQELAQERARESLQEAKQQAAEIINQAQRRSNEIIEEAKNAAVEEGDRLKAAAQAEIEREVSKAREALRKDVSSVALQGVEKILGKEVDASAHSKVLEELASQI
ncbi:MAG TPA: F0F1 ATP synthase subunit B [Gammaproteobacteria bacterium]|nr:F0F1 ATP synthase subunit B [Gammaproteobacteria bacterium]